MIWGLQIVYFCGLLAGRQNLSSPTCETCRHFCLNLSLGGGKDSWRGIRGGLHQKGEWCHHFSIIGRSQESGSSSIVLWTGLSVSLALGISFFVNNIEREETAVLWGQKDLCYSKVQARLVLCLEMEKHLPLTVHSPCKEPASSGLTSQGLHCICSQMPLLPKSLPEEWGR